MSDPDKTLTMLNSWTRYDMDRWASRNTRFERDQTLWLLTQPADLNPDILSDLTILNDPKVLVRKTSALIARHPAIIEVPAAPDVEPDIAQRIENWLYQWVQSVNQRWMMGLHSPYRYDQAFYMILRGWLCERTLLAPEGEDDLDTDAAAIWDHQVFDPANLYPHTSGNGVDRVTHVYTVPAGELKFDPFFADFAEDCLHVGEPDEIDDRTTLEIRATYWRDRSDDSGGNGNAPSWWHAVTGGTLQTNNNSARGSYASGDGFEFVKEPEELGYNPWSLTISKGASYRNTPWDSSEEYLSELGTGILDEGYDTYKQINRMATKLSALLTTESNPPTTIYLQNNVPVAFATKPGSRNFLTQKDKVEFHRIGPGVNDFKLLWDILQQRASRAGLPPQFYGEGGGAESGIAQASMMAAGKDVLFPFVEGINASDQLVMRKALEIYRDFGPSKPLNARMPPDGLGRVLSGTISASDIQKQGVFIDVRRDDMTPQELAQRINLGIAALREKGISLKTFRRDWMNLKNPDAENLQVLAEQVYLNEDVIKQLTPIALQATGADTLKQIWSMVQNPLPAMSSPQGPGMPVPAGQIPTQGPQMPPSVGSGVGPAQPALPPTTLPTAMATGNPLTNVQVGAVSPDAAAMNALLALLNGGAQGGAGGGGLPPNPATLSPTAVTPPPGRMAF